MKLLERYHSSVKNIPESCLPAFCYELRVFLIEHIAQTGGHLASNLGVVELTVALHRVFDTSYDRIVFDVGHQCYVHKILTGRMSGFSSLRAFGSLAGFPKPHESIHDSFVAGHASTSVSAALGMARARTLSGSNYDVVAILGDGALTGGMAYEALNDAGQSGQPMIIILNDNEMSITNSVGGVSWHLANLRIKPQYIGAKKIYHKFIDPLPGGQLIDTVLHRTKTAVKSALLPGSMFEQMGFIYLGPIDGHDIKALVTLLNRAKNLRRPVIIHAVTTKGKGYRFSEERPAQYHGIGSFDIGSGKTISKNEKTYSHVFGNKICRLAKTNKKICAITAAMKDGTGLSGFAKAYPRRFFDVGIAEAHAVTMAAGLAIQGMRPVVSIYSTFLQRAYDQIIHDVAIQNLPVIFAIDRAGLVGEDGETHHGVFDAYFLFNIPNLQVWCPASFEELEVMLEHAFDENSPIAIRYPRFTEGIYTNCHLEPVCLRAGSQATIVTYGYCVNHALAAAGLLNDEGISCGVVKIACLQPLNTQAITPLLNGYVFLVEDGMGVLPMRLQGIPINLDGRFVPHGSYSELISYCEISPEDLARRIYSYVQ